MISNALDAMPPLQPLRGKLRVRCFRAKDELRNMAGVRFLFSDNGVGIPAASLPHVFSAFYTTKETRGSGVGLWLSAEIVEKHHGRIRLRTRTEGRYRGTLFDVFLPFAKAE
jgi:signal transduction histidine kinase